MMLNSKPSRGEQPVLENQAKSIVNRRSSIVNCFDALAARYDTVWTDSFVGRLQREETWQAMDHTFRRGELILDIGCGTGADAAHLARAGVRVHAVDISPEMLRRTSQRIESLGLLNLVTCELRAMEDLPHIQKRTFDGAISNFGALNCIEDLDSLAARLAGLLRPEGRLILCFMGRFCFWETIWYLIHGQPHKSRRRFQAAAVWARLSTSSGQAATPGDGMKRGIEVSAFSEQRVRVYYHSYATMRRAFRKHFRLVSDRSIGLFVPPSYAESFGASHPGLFRQLAALDHHVGGWPLLRSAGDHRLVILARKVE